MTIDYSLALSHLLPDAQWAMDNNEYNSIQWFSTDAEKPTIEELEIAYANYKIQETTKVNARQSALAKLAALGLTEEEVAAL